MSYFAAYVLSLFAVLGVIKATEVFCDWYFRAQRQARMNKQKKS